MKQLLTIAVAALSATAMQAASINWGGDTLNSANTTPGWEGYANAGTVYTLVLCGDTAPSAPSTYDPATGLTDVGGTAVASHTVSDSEANNGQWAGDAYVADESAINGWYMVTVYDASTGTADYTTFQVSGVTNSGGAADVGPSIAGLGNSMGSVAVVPEPTTVALLALGLAAVGLKRKVA